MMNVLFIDACVRKESRTSVLAQDFLKGVEGNITTIKIYEEQLLPLDEERLEKRDRLIASGQFNDKFFTFAHQFATADEIVIATPFWDLSFPSMLKIYLENVTVAGITFKYDNGIPKGLCCAKKATYITTAGGKIFEDFGFSYIKALAKGLFGIPEVVCIRAENLDVKCVIGKEVLNEPIQTIK